MVDCKQKQNEHSNTPGKACFMKTLKLGPRSLFQAIKCFLQLANLALAQCNMESR